MESGRFRRSSVLFAGVVCIAAAAACASTSGMDTEGMPDTQPAAAGMTDAGIAGVARTANAGGLEQAQLAVTKASNAAVRQFAERLVAAHRDANSQLDQLLTQLNLSPMDAPLATELQQNATRTLETLRPLEGDAFDRAFIDNQITLHESLLRTIDDNLIPAASADGLQAYLRSMRGTVAEHLEQARQIRTSLGG